jgi:hypothetical protein
VTDTNLLLERHRPWELAAAARRGDRSAGTTARAVVTDALGRCGLLAEVLEPFAPALARTVRGHLERLDDAPVFERRAAFT